MRPGLAPPRPAEPRRRGARGWTLGGIPERRIIRRQQDPAEPVGAAPRGDGLARAWTRVWERLSGLLGAHADRVEVRVARLADDVEDIHTRHVVEALERSRGVRVRPLARTIELGLIGDPGQQLVKAVDEGREQLFRADADLLIWGEAPQPGTTLTLRFVSSLPEDDDRPGYFGPATYLNLPANFSPELARILLAATLAATTPRSEAKRLGLSAALPKALKEAIPVYQDLPADLTEGERASARLCMGNVLATVAARQGAAELNQVAAQAYRSALEAIDKEEMPVEWATAQRNLGVVLQALGEQTDDAEVLGAAADAYRAALGVIAKEQFPRVWASLQGRLGQMLYKLDLKTGDTELVKHALSAYQAALQVFTRKDSPNRWADIMNNFAQAAQMLGGQLRNVEVLTTAADACRSVLEVRSREEAPSVWAAVQNNLGSALFLIAKEDRRDVDHLKGAIEAFARARDLYTELKATKLVAITEKNLARAEKLLEDRGGADGRPPRLHWEGDGDDASVPAKSPAKAAKPSE